MRENDANLMLAALAFIAASVSKLPGLDYGLYLLSAAYLIPVALSELTHGMLWLSRRIDRATELLERKSQRMEESAKPTDNP